MKDALQDKIAKSGLTDLQFLQGLNGLKDSEFQEKVKTIVEDIVYYQNSNNKDIQELSRKITLKINDNTLSEHLMFFIKCLDGDILLSSFEFQDLCSELALKVPVGFLGKHFEFFIDIARKENQASSLCQKLALKIPVSIYGDRLQYLIERCTKEYCPEEYLCQDLIRKIPSKNLLENLEYILKTLRDCRFIYDQRAVNICIDNIGKRISGEHLSEHLKCLMEYLKTPQISKTGCGYDKSFCNELLMKIKEEDIIKELKYLINFQTSDDERIVKLSYELIMKIPDNLLKSKVDVIQSGLKSKNKNVLELCQKLAVKIGDKEYCKNISKRVMSVLNSI